MAVFELRDPGTRPFAFVVPFKPRSVCSDWERAQEHLRRTVRSAVVAGGEQALVVVVCHDQPDLRDVAGLNVVVLAAPFAEPTAERGGGHDKAAKRRHGAAWLRDRAGKGSIYVMFLDADDLVHRDVVRWTLADARPSYLLGEGFTFDAALGLLQHRPREFYLTCGSTFICRFDADELPARWDDLAAPFSQFGATPHQRGHEEYGDIASEQGKPPAPVPFPAVVYTVNHGENLRNVKTGGPRPLLPFEAVRPRSAKRILRDDFTCPEAAAAVAAGRTFALLAVRVSAKRLAVRLRRAVRRLRPGVAWRRVHRWAR